MATATATVGRLSWRGVLGRAGRAGLVLALAVGAAARGEATEAGVETLDRVRRRVERSFCFRARLAELWPTEVVEEARARVRAAPDAAADATEINALLAKLGASHAELLPRSVYRQEYGAESRGEASIRFGLELAPRAQQDGGTRWFLTEILPGGAAWEAGLCRGDEVLAVDGAAPGDDARTAPFGDCGVPHARHRLIKGEEPARLLIRTRDGVPPVEVELAPQPWSRQRASGASVRVIGRAGRRIGYLRLFHVLHPDAARVLEEAVTGPLAGVDALILDLRGWGGRVDVLNRILAMLPGARRPLYEGPLVALVDERTRSAKEVAAHELTGRGITLVGRNTAGAVLGCDFFPIGNDHVLMLPVQDVTRLSGGVRLEGQGVPPTLFVADDLPFAGGRDAVLDTGLAAALELSSRARASAAAPLEPSPAPPPREPALF